jgi:hypothetical protein
LSPSFSPASAFFSPSLAASFFGSGGGGFQVAIAFSYSIHLSRYSLAFARSSLTSFPELGRFSRSVHWRRTAVGSPPRTWPANFSAAGL